MHGDGFDLDLQFGILHFGVGAFAMATELADRHADRDKILAGGVGV